MKNISAYWKCQLIAWPVYVSIACWYAVYKGMPYPIPKFLLSTAVIMIILGITLSHQMKRLIRVLNVLQKPVNSQIFYFLGLTALFTLLFWLLLSLFSFRLNIVAMIGYFRRIDLSTLIDFFFQYLFFSAALLIWNLIYFIFQYIHRAKKEELLKFQHEKELLELEAKALRAQMNPHFIFNCLNSIKSLMQEDEKEKSITYLTTFAKLIRTLLNNADKKEISLYDEIETCKLYLALEAMRFDTKFTYTVKPDDTIDLKSILVPALTIQPFIENAIWHGIVPRDSGGHVEVSVHQNKNSINIIIEDDGVGRKTIQENKSAENIVHHSKGVQLIQNRLHLDSLIKQRKADLEIIDKKNNEGIAQGTKVILTFKEPLV